MKIEIINLENGSAIAEHQKNGFLWIAKELRKRGFEVSAVIHLAESDGAIKNALFKLFGSPGVKIIIGRPGNFQDDLISIDSISQASSFYLSSSQGISEAFEKEPTRFNLQKLKIIKNIQAKSKGLVITKNESTFIFLPNDGRDQKILFRKNVLPILEEIQMDSRRSGSLFFRTFGVPTSILIEKLNKIRAKGFNAFFNYWSRFPETCVMVSLKGKSQREMKKQLNSLHHLVYECFGDSVFSGDGRSMEEVVGDLLRMKGFTLAIAESCTGGFLGHKFTNVPGSSKYFLGGIIAYSNEAKMNLLGVPREILERFGAVSAPVARKMAQGIRKINRSTIGLSITGIAGPEGGSVQKPVGTVFIGLSSPKGTWAKKLHLKGNREQIKTLSAYSVMDFLRKYLIRLS